MLKFKSLKWLSVPLVFLIACSGAEVAVPTFDSGRSFVYLEDQVAFGPRVPGSEAWRLCGLYFTQFFDSLGCKVDSQVFSFRDPYSGRTLPLVNIIASIDGNGTTTDRLVLMAHYDSRPRTDYATDTTLFEQPIDGANDGASGVAVLMELANLLTANPPPCNIDLVLADGEDWGRPGDLDYYMLGSREFARYGIRDKYRFGIVIDLIGDADLRIPREGFSELYNSELNDMVFDAAKRLGVTSFVDSLGVCVHDDHLSLNAGGVPTIDLIDFDYKYWHTEFDTPDKCSPESLEDVGRVLLEIIYRPSLWPAKK